MMKVYLAVPRAADRLLGHVTEDGKVYRKRVGPDEHVGRVDLDSGKVYESRIGPDKKIGHVDLEHGRVYLSRLGPDVHIGTVHGDGRIERHLSLTRNDHVGRVDPFISFAHSASAMLLLVLPAIEPAAVSEPPAEDGPPA